jgi:hypothetical protein
MSPDGRMRGCVSRVLISVAALTAPGCATVGPQDFDVSAELYQTATVDPGGGLRIVTVDGRTIRIAPDRELMYDRHHRSTDDLVISPDRTAVGAIAQYGDEAYPMALVVYSRGRLHRFRADPMIWEWRFDDSGSRVAYRQSPLHLHLPELRIARGGIGATY